MNALYVPLMKSFSPSNNSDLRQHSVHTECQLAVNLQYKLIKHIPFQTSVLILTNFFLTFTN